MQQATSNIAADAAAAHAVPGHCNKTRTTSSAMCLLAAPANAKRVGAMTQKETFRRQSVSDSHFISASIHELCDFWLCDFWFCRLKTASCSRSAGPTGPTTRVASGDPDSINRLYPSSTCRTGLIVSNHPAIGINKSRQNRKTRCVTSGVRELGRAQLKLDPSCTGGYSTFRKACNKTKASSLTAAAVMTQFR